MGLVTIAEALLAFTNLTAVLIDWIIVGALELLIIPSLFSIYSPVSRTGNAVENTSGTSSGAEIVHTGVLILRDFAKVE